jgi:hypothetical protein
VATDLNIPLPIKKTRLPPGSLNLTEKRAVTVPLTIVISVAVGSIKELIVPQRTQIVIRKTYLFTSLIKAKRGCAMNDTDRSYTVG